MLTLHLNEFFFSINGISRSCCWIKHGNKTTRWNFVPRQKFTLTHPMKHRRVLSSRTYGFSFASAKPTRWKYLKILITFSTAHLFFDMLQYCYYRGELPISWHSRPRGCLKLYFEPYWWNESDFALGWEVITFYQNPRHLISPKMLMGEKKVTIALR